MEDLPSAELRSRALVACAEALGEAVEEAAEDGSDYTGTWRAGP